MKRFRLTKTAKVLILLLVIAAIGGGVFAGIKTGFIKTDKPDKEDAVLSDSKDVTAGSNNASDDISDTKNNDKNTISSGSSDTINLSIDEWVGYATILQANGGLNNAAR